MCLAASLSLPNDSPRASMHFPMIIIGTKAKRLSVIASQPFCKQAWKTLQGLDASFMLFQVNMHDNAASSDSFHCQHAPWHALIVEQGNDHTCRASVSTMTHEPRACLLMVLKAASHGQAGSLPEVSICKASCTPALCVEGPGLMQHMYDEPTAAARSMQALCLHFNAMPGACQTPISLVVMHPSVPLPFDAVLLWHG